MDDTVRVELTTRWISRQRSHLRKNALQDSRLVRTWLLVKYDRSCSIISVIPCYTNHANIIWVGRGTLEEERIKKMQMERR